MCRHNPVAKAIADVFEQGGRRGIFTRFLSDGSICLTQNKPERALRRVTLGRKAWLFAGSSYGGNQATFLWSLTVTGKMNDASARAERADMLARMPSRILSRHLECVFHAKVGSYCTGSCAGLTGNQTAKVVAGERPGATMPTERLSMRRIRDLRR